MSRRVRVGFAEAPPELVRRAATAGLADFDLRLPDTDEPGAIEAAISGCDAILVRRRPLGSRQIEVAKPRLVVALGRNPTAVDEAAVEASGARLIAIPHPGAIAVADHALALLLAVARRVVEGDRGVRGGAYRDRRLAPTPTTEASFAFNWLGRSDAFVLAGRELGLVGFGAIGQEVARRAAGFSMRVRYFMRRPLPAAWNRRLGVAPAESLDDLLASADVVSLHLPHTDATDTLFDRATLGRMKRGAVLINTARGGLVDETALAEALEDGRLAGAGLDVFREEPLPAGHRLTAAPGVVLAPHTGGAGAGGQRALFEHVAASLHRLLAADDATT